MNLRSVCVKWGGRKWVRFEQAESAVAEERKLREAAEAKYEKLFHRVTSAATCNVMGQTAAAGIVKVLERRIERAMAVLLWIKRGGPAQALDQALEMLLGQDEVEEGLLREAMEAQIDAEVVTFGHKRLVISSLVQSSPAVVEFLRKEGLKTDDMLAMHGQTLWGQEVADTLYSGILAGLKHGVAPVSYTHLRAHET